MRMTKLMREQVRAIEGEGIEVVKVEMGGKHVRAVGTYQDQPVKIVMPCSTINRRGLDHVRLSVRREKRRIEQEQEIAAECQSEIRVGPVPVEADETVEPRKECKMEQGKINGVSEPEKKPKKERYVLDQRDKLRLGVWMQQHYRTCKEGENGEPVECEITSGLTEQEIYNKAMKEGLFDERYAYHTFQIFRSQLFGKTRALNQKKAHANKSGDAEVALQMCADMETAIGTINQRLDRIEDALKPLIKGF